MKEPPVESQTIENESGQLISIYKHNGGMLLRFRELGYNYVVVNNNLFKVSNFFLNIHKGSFGYWTAVSLNYAIPSVCTTCSDDTGSVYILFDRTILRLDCLRYRLSAVYKTRCARFLPRSASAVLGARLVNFGGLQVNQISGDFNVYDLASGRECVLRNAAVRPQFGARLTALDGRLYLFGGQNGNGRVAGCYEIRLILDELFGAAGEF